MNGEYSILDCEYIVDLGMTFRSRSAGTTGIRPETVAELSEQSRSVAQASAEEGSRTATDERVRELGRSIYEAAGASMRAAADASCPVCLGVQTRAPATWREIEEIAWEACHSEKGFLAEEGTPIVRGWGSESIPPLDLGSRPLKLLTIGASPADKRVAYFDLADVVTGVRQAWTGRICQPEFKLLARPNTLDGIERLLATDPVWDIVHVVAHGERKKGTERPEPVVLLEGDGDERGSAAWTKVAEFARALRRLEAPQLITLNVCDSSPLAIELMSQFSGRTRVVALLGQGREESLASFFRHLYTELFRVRRGAERDTDVHIASAFGVAVQALLRENRAQWFLPVLYAPITPTPLIRTTDDPEYALRDALDEVGDSWGDSRAREAALSRLGGLFEDPNPVISDAATNLHKACTSLATMERNFEDLVRQIGERPDWDELYRQWQDKQVTMAKTYSPEVVLVSTAALDTFAALQPTRDRVVQAYEGMLGALAELARFRRRREASTLRNACAGVEAALEASFATDYGDVPSVVFRHAVTALTEEDDEDGSLDAQTCLARASELREAAQLLADPGDRLATPEELAALRTQLEEAQARLVDRAVAGRLAEATGLLASTPSLADPREQWDAVAQAVDNVAHAEEVLARCSEWPGAGESCSELEAVSGQARDIVASLAAPAGSPSSELLEADRRLDLYLWLVEREQGESQGDAQSPVPTDLAELRAYIARTQRQLNSAADRSFGDAFPAALTLVANERAPIRPQADLVDGPSPYLWLHQFGVGPDTATPDLKDATDFQIQEVDDPDRQSAMRLAATKLSSTPRRLRVDFAHLPCDDATLLSERLHEIASDVFAGRSPSAGATEGLSDMDAQSLRAAYGDTEAAASEAFAAALAQPGSDALLHHAFLLAAHDAAVAARTTRDYPAAARRAFALHGIVESTAQRFSDWILTRFAIYHQEIPADVDEYIREVRHEAQRLVETTLSTYGEVSDECRAEARELRREWLAEIEGARLATEYRLRLEEGRTHHGGYLAASLGGDLPTVGQLLRDMFVHLANLSEDDELLYVRATGMSREACEHLALAFSGYRIWMVDPDDESIATLRRLVPDRMELPSTDLTPALEELLSRDDFAEAYPVHARLAKQQRANLMAAHAALLLGRALLAQTKSYFAAQDVRNRRTAIVANLQAVDLYDQHIRDMGGTLAPSGLDSARAGLSLEWLGQIKARIDKLDEADAAPDQSDLDHIAEHLKLADQVETMTAGRVHHGDFSEALSRIHFSYSVLLANKASDLVTALLHVRRAHSGLPEDEHIMYNYLVACVQRGFQALMADERGDANRAFEEGLRQGERFLLRTGHETTRIREQLDRLNEGLSMEDAADGDERPKWGLLEPFDD